MLESRRIKQGDLQHDVLVTFKGVADFYRDQQLYNKAKPYMLRAVWGRRLTLGDTHAHTLESWNQLIELYETCDKPEKAKTWRAKLPQTKAAYE
jgi:hypothetical protein